jgi:serine/threonine-protein kinase
MEYISGARIDDYCDRHNLSVDRRVRLFLPVLAAVQHAHQALIVHRDLKPDNVLVSDDGDPKLLDFGIAKILDLGGEAGQLTTAYRSMTPRYASPEQIRGELVGTTSDIYSLGVLLYQLLTGRLPYVLTDESPMAIDRAICEQTPMRPARS